MHAAGVKAIPIATNGICGIILVLWWQLTGIRMPLQSGKSSKIRGANVRELVDTYESKGKIGTSHPKSKKAAIKQAVAISYSKAGEQNFKPNRHKR